MICGRVPNADLNGRNASLSTKSNRLSKICTKIKLLKYLCCQKKVSKKLKN